MSKSFCKKKKLGRCNLQFAPPYLMLLYVKVIFMKKKFGRCNLQIAPPYLKLLYGKVWSQSISKSFARKKNLGGAICKLHRPIWSYSMTKSFARKKIWVVQFTNCTTPSEATLWQSLKPVYFKVICKKKKFGRCNLQIATPRVQFSDIRTRAQILKKNKEPALRILDLKNRFTF